MIKFFNKSHLVKYFVILGVAGFTTSLLAESQVKRYMFSHPQWSEEVEVKDNKFCKKNGDCATIEVVEEGKILVKWDKWNPETFVQIGNTLSWRYISNHIEKEYEQFVYSLEEPFLKVNPYGKTPLSALLKFPTDEETKISIRIKGKDGAPDIVHEFDGFKKEHNIPLLGLFPNHNNKVVIRAKNKKGVSKTSEINVQIGNPEEAEYWFPIVKKDKNFHYYALSEGLVFDEIGNLRYQFVDFGWYLTYFYKDNVFVEHRRYINRYSLFGEIIQKYTYPQGFYSYMHGMGFKDNGNLLIYGSFGGSKAVFDGVEQETHRDFVLELDGETGKELARYDLAEMINPDRSLIIRSAFKEDEKVDWVHTNGIDYDAKNKAIIVSGRHFGILKIDEKTKKPIWWMTPHQLTHKSGRKGDKGDVSHLLLTAVDKNGKPYSKAVQQGIEKASGFKWPLKTHSVRYAGKGVVSIFDNSGDMYDKKLYTTKNSVGSVFKIDDKKKTVQQLFLKELPHYSETGSIVFVHPKTKDYWVVASNVQNKNHTKMRDAHIHRFDKNGNEVYHAVFHNEGNAWPYMIYPYEFYSKNSWPTPQE